MRFKVGDVVKCVDDGSCYGFNATEHDTCVHKGKVYEITHTRDLSLEGDPHEYVSVEGNGIKTPNKFYHSRFERMTESSAHDRDPDLSMRLNSGKPELRYVFCFLPAIEELAKTCMVGAQKYALYNFMKPCTASESFDCLTRHLGAVWFKGELVDDQGNSHLGAITFNALRFVTTIVTNPVVNGKEMDDRPCKVLKNV